MENVTKKLKISHYPQLTCMPPTAQVKNVYLLDPKDCVFENGIIIRIKRKYGKFKRVVNVIDNRD
jgi:hypothetical protein